MMPREIIIAPVITEKSTADRESRNVYTFKVSLNANKIEIKRAIEKLFSVGVVSVNTIRRMGKMKRVGRYVGKRPDFKKAVVKLRDGDRIPDFEQ